MHQITNPFDIFEDVFKADLVINVPIAKTHGLARLTLGMKNMMGLIQNRTSVHLNFAARLTDLNRTIHPALTVMDAVRILTANGPSGGNLDDVKQLDTIIATTDVVAADSYATGFFGMKPSDLDYIVEATKAGLGVSDLNIITDRGIDGWRINGLPPARIGSTARKVVQGISLSIFTMLVIASTGLAWPAAVVNFPIRLDPLSHDRPIHRRAADSGWILDLFGIGHC